tara:strand:- start:30 stop:344 length:315 start_codon:yes stop_codon:yes gene_type:complete
MKKTIINFLNKCFYCSIEGGCVYSVDNGSNEIGYSDLEIFIRKTFDLDEDFSYALTFNWLLENDAPLIRKNWNHQFIAHNTSVLAHYEQTLTEDIDFEYIIVNE